MAKPTEFYQWSISTETYNITIGTTIHNVPNIAAPVAGDPTHDFTINGVLKNTGLPVQYYNYLLSGISQWSSYIDTMYVGGDVVSSHNSYDTQQLTEKYGGDWELLGTKTTGGELEYYYRKLGGGYEPPANLSVIPLTYDELDYDGTVFLVRQGSSEHVSPEGFQGNGWDSRLKSTSYPSWIDITGTFEVQSTISFYKERVMTATGDVALYIGPDSSGISPTPSLQYKIMPDPDNSYKTYLQFETYDSALRTTPICRSEWYYRFRFPQINTVNGEVRPQGIYFIDGNTALVAGHYENTESIIFQVDLTDNSVLGQFSFGTTTHRHISSIAEDSLGNIWVSDYETGSVLQIDVDASLLSQSAVILADWDVSILNSLGNIGFASSGGTAYVLLQEYAISGTPYLYVVPESLMGDGLVFAIGDRYKRFSGGLRAQGVVVDSSGDLWISRNTDASSSTASGWVENYGDADQLISGIPDDFEVVPVSSYDGPGRYVEDLAFHPTTGDIWTLTEGWQAVGDYDGWLSVWSSPLNNSPVENTISCYLNGGTISLKVNNQIFQDITVTPTQPIETLSIGAPPQVSQGLNNGIFRGTIKNIAFSEAEITAETYQHIVDGTFESNSLQEYEITLTNPGAESGDTTGWVDEVGNLSTRTANPTPYQGGYYFAGGPNLNTTARQRLDIVASTGLTTTEIDSGGLWCKLFWKQASYTDQDPVTLGIRMLDSSQVEIDSSFGEQDWVPDGDSGATPNWRSLCIGHPLPVGARYIDIVYDATRTSGTNLDGYVDNISCKIYRKGV